MATAACSSVSALTASEHGEPGLKSCVFCGVKQPEDGRFLHCLHVSCVGCLNDNLTSEGCIECGTCNEETKPRLPGVAISKLLVSSRFGTSEASDEVTGEQETPLCDFCETNSAKAATHECEECDGILLCTTHAQDHSKKRVFRTHHVTELDAVSSGNSDTGRKQLQYSCPLHGKHEVTDFCRTCQVVACEQCLLRGHRQHDVVSLSETAAEQRVVLRNELPRSDGQTAHTSPDRPVLELMAMKEELEYDITHSNGEATAASKVITEAFSGFRSLLDQREGELLKMVDTARWKTQRAAEHQLHRLDIIELKNTTAIEIGKFLTSEMGAGCDAEVMMLAPLVLSKMKSLKSDVEAEKKSHSPSGSIQAAMNKSEFDKLERCVERIVSVSSGLSIELENCTVEFPDPLQTDQECSACLHLGQQAHASAAGPDVEDCIKKLEVSVTSASAEKRTLPAEELSTDAEQGMVRIPILVSNPGQHLLHVRSGIRARDFEFSVTNKPRFEFDKRRCSHNIAISECGCTVHFSGHPGGYHNVLGTVPYTSGTHHWSVRVQGYNLGSGCMGIGVTTVPDGDFLRQRQRLLNTGYGWWSHSSTYGLCKDKALAAQCSEWQDGDILDFTLDCDAHTLELHNRRVNERKKIQDVVGNGTPLFMLVCLTGHDRTVTLLGR